jgi:hypothetical protein
MREFGMDKNITQSAQVHVKIENWGIYPRIMAEVVSQGGFIQ